MADGQPTEPMRTRFDRLRARTEDAAVAPKATVRFGIYAVVGIAVGLAVAALQWIALDVLLDRLLDAPLWVQALAPGAALLATVVLLRGRTTPATSDDYVRVYHSNADLRPREIVPKLVAAVACLGGGAAFGAEGPSVYAGASIGQRLGARLTGMLGVRGRRSLSAAGAAAGVAAIFQAPATGVLFALETPYQRDVARRALIPALIAAATSYLTFTAIFGVHSYLPVPRGEVRLRDELLGAVVLGVCAGIAARGLATLWSAAKKLPGRYPAPARLAGAATVVALTLVGARALTGTSFTLGPGTDMVAAIAVDADLALWVVAAAFALRAVATAAALGAGGVGGLFVPLVVQGLLLGRLVEGLFTDPAPGLYPVIGLAAVLGAGYRTPLAAVMFVAETTGQAQYVIPALIATAVSQAVMGDRSVASHQVHEREGLLERRMRQRVRNHVVEVPVLHADELVTAVIDGYGDRPPAQALPVCDDRYRGLLFLRDLAAALFEHGPDATVGDVVHDVPAVHVEVPTVEAARLMAELDTAVLAVVDDDDQPVGVVTALTITGALDYDPDD